ncbi:MAG: penicillin-binding protein 2, partial [Gammaproteobacteria bacterium]|nr:penicillin-binding protein 2 [Gammaproteobacteria bacterium]
MISGNFGSLRDSQERATVNRRIWLLATLMLLALAGVLGRFAEIQLSEHATYAARAENNRVRLQAIAPNRGLILDRHGRVLAENRPAYRLVMVPERVPDREQAFNEIDRLVGLNDAEREQARVRISRSRRFQPITIKGNLDEREVATLALDRHRLNGLEIEPYLIRHYPYG